MLSNAPAPAPDCGSKSSDTNLNRQTRSSSQFILPECDVQRTTYIPMREPPDEREPEVDDLTPSLLSFTMSRISGVISAYSWRRASVSDDGLGGGGIEGPAMTSALPWQSKTLASFTMYGELCVALTQEEFALVRTRLRREWAFNGSLLLGLSAVNAAVFALTPDSTFKVDSYACTAVAISSTACGLGIACDSWFLFRYSWVGLGTFICRTRDIYGSYVFFSLSSRIPTFCMLVSITSFMFFLGLIAYDARPVVVLVICVFVALVMILQFIVYGTHYCATFTLSVWRARAVEASEV